MIFRGIPVSIILCFVVFVFIEIAKRYWIKDEELYDWIPVVLVGIGLIYGSIGAWVFNLDFATTFADILILLAPGGLFKFLKVIAPNVITKFERNE